MTEKPNIAANTADFEFAALAEAKNYREALFAEFQGALRGEVIEVGAGIGQMTEHLVQLPQVRRALACHLVGEEIEVRLGRRDGEAGPAGCRLCLFRH